MAIGQYSELQTALDNWMGDTTLAARRNEFISLAEDDLGQDLRVRAMEASIDLTLENAVSLTAAEVAGTANAITFTPGTAATSNTLGDTYRFEAEATNTSSVTLDVSSLGPVALNKDDGTVALEAGDIVNGGSYDVYHDGTRFRLLPHSGAVPLPSRFVQMRRLFLLTDPVRALDFMPPMDFHKRFVSTQTAKPSAFTIENEYVIFGAIQDSSYQARMLYYRRFAALSAASDTNWILSNARGLLLYGAMKHAAAFRGNDRRLLVWAAKYDDLLEKVMAADQRDRHSGAPLVARSDVFGV